MKASQFFISTLKEAPADAEIVSHQLMLRAGMLRKLAAGLYTWSPLGLRVLRSILEQPERTPILAILTYRPAPGQPWRRLPNFVEHTLAPLGED